MPTSEGEIYTIDRALTLLERAASSPAEAVSLTENPSLKDALDRGLALLAGSYPLHAVPTLLRYGERIAETYRRRGGGERPFKEKAAKAAWDIFWTKVMGYKESPSMPGESKPLSEKEKAAYEYLLNKLAGYLDVAMSKAYETWLSARESGQDVETSEKTPASSSPGLLTPIGEKDGVIKLQYWLDEIYRRWRGLEHMPLSEEFYRRLADLTRRAKTLHKATLEYMAEAMAAGARKIEWIYESLPESKKREVAEKVKNKK